LSSDPTLSPEQRRELEEAGGRARRILSADKVASFNGWTIGIFAAMTLLFGLGSVIVMGLAVGLGVVARNEFRGRAMLRRFEPSGGRFLGRNQLGLMALIVAYSLWSIWRAKAGPPDPEMEQLQDLVGVGSDLIQQLTVVLYLGVIAATAIFQGLNARYYFRRVAMTKAYLVETPAWVVDLQRSAALD
jgi:hypothetical protein